jgi:drug/metabolite transporter (DMT)-like permease
MTPRFWILLVMSALLASLNFLFIKVGEKSYDPLFLSWGRLGVAALTMALILPLFKGGKSTIQGAFKEIRLRPASALLLGSIWFAIPFTLLTLGETHVSSSLAGILTTSSPLIAALLALFIDRSERVGVKQFGGLVIGFIGVGVLLGFESVSSSGEFLGALLILGAATCWASAGFITKLRYRHTPPLQITFISAVVSATLTLPLALITLPTSPPALKATIALIAQGILGTAVLNSLNNFIIGKVGVGMWMMGFYLSPIFILFNGAVFLDETITAATLAGVALILFGIAIRSRSVTPRIIPETELAPAAKESRRRAPPTAETEIKTE